MTIGADIKEVFQEIGVPYTIIRDSGNITGEYCDLEVIVDDKSTFFRDFVYVGDLSHDSVLTTGDIIYVTALSCYFLVVSVSSDQFEGSIYMKTAQFYKCNVIGTLFRQLGEDWDANYKTTGTWTSIKTGVRGVLINREFGEIPQNLQFGQIQTSQLTLFVPTAIDVQPLDRFWITNLDYWKIESVESRRISNVSVCEIVEDTRSVSWTTTSTTTTSSTTTSTTSSSSTSSTTTTTSPP